MFACVHSYTCLTVAYFLMKYCACFAHDLFSYFTLASHAAPPLLKFIYALGCIHSSDCHSSSPAVQ